MDDEWLTVKHAAELYNEVISDVPLIRRMSPGMCRKLCRDGVLADVGIRTQKLDNGYIISRADMLERIQLEAGKTAERAFLALGLPESERGARFRAIVKQVKEEM